MKPSNALAENALAENALADKGDAVEEWIDLHFFRPLGLRVARGLAGTRATADHVTVGALVIGLIGGHLFVYDDWRLGALGLALVIVSDVFDSADGQLARLRGTSTRFGRILDGISDNLRFINLYLHLLVRLVLTGGGWPVVVLVIAAGASHSLQAAAADFMRQAYLRLSGPRGGELDLPENLPAPTGGFWRRFALRSYASYVRRQAWLFPRTVALVRERQHAETTADAEATYRAALRPTVASAAWIGQNIRFALLAVTALVGWPAGYFWLTLVPLNLALIVLVGRHERLVRRRVADHGQTHVQAAYVA